MPNPLLKRFGQAADPEEARALRAEGDASIRAYHGSPHEFDRFELSPRTIGTGQGDRVYGYGLNFTESESAARGWTPKGGRTYEVDIRASPDDFLDVDKPIGAQSDVVKARIASLGDNPNYDPNIHAAIAAIRGEHPDPSVSNWANASDVYDDVVALYGGEEAAANALRGAGVSGVRYVDPASKSVTNYVVFDDQTINVLRRYGIAAVIGVGALAAVSGAGPGSEAEASPIGRRVQSRMPELREWARGLRPQVQRETGSRVYPFDVSGKPAQVLLDFDERGSITVNWGWTDQGGAFAYRTDMAPSEIVETWARVWAIVERDAAIRGRREYQFSGFEGANLDTGRMGRQARTQLGIMEEVSPPRGFTFYQLEHPSMPGEPVYVIRRTSEPEPTSEEFFFVSGATVRKIEKKPKGGMLAPTAAALSLFAGGGLASVGFGDPAEAQERITADPRQIADAIRAGERVELLPQGGARIGGAPPSPPPAPPARRAREPWEDIARFQGVSFAPRERPRFANIITEQWAASLDQFTLVYADNARARAWAHGFDEQNRAIRELTGESPPDPYAANVPVVGPLFSNVTAAIATAMTGGRRRFGGAATVEANVEARMREREAWLRERGLLEQFPIDRAYEVGLERITETERRMIEVASVPSEGPGEAATRLGAGLAASFAGAFQDPFQASMTAIPGAGGSTRLMAAARAAALNAAVTGGIELSLQQEAQALREEVGLERENIRNLVLMAAGLGGLFGGALGALGGAPRARAAPEPGQVIDDMVTGLRGLREEGLLDPAGVRTLEELEALQAGLAAKPEGVSVREHLRTLRETQERLAAEPPSPYTPPRQRLPDDAFDDPLGEGARAQVEELARELEARAARSAAEEPAGARPAGAVSEAAPAEPPRVRLPSGEERPLSALFLPDGSFDSAAALDKAGLRQLDAIMKDIAALKGEGAVRAPERFSDWVVRQGGVQDLGGDIVFAAGEAATAIRRPRIRGRFVKAGSVVSERGMSLDDLALRAWEEGWFPHLRERPHTNELIEALADDLNDVTPLYHGEDEAARARIERLADLDRELDERGVDLHAEERVLRTQIAESFGLIPESFAPPSRTGDDLGDLTPVETLAPVERADESGLIRYDLAPEIEAFREAERAEFFVERFKDCVT